MSLQQNDSTIFGAINNERNRQLQTRNLFASENFVSEGVLEAMGSVLTNKYDRRLFREALLWWL